MTQTTDESVRLIFIFADDRNCFFRVLGYTFNLLFSTWETVTMEILLSLAI